MEQTENKALDKAKYDLARYQSWVNDPVTKEVIRALELSRDNLVARISTQEMTDEEAGYIRATVRIYNAFLRAPAMFIKVFSHQITQEKERFNWNKLVDPDDKNTDDVEEQT